MRPDHPQYDAPTTEFPVLTDAPSRIEEPTRPPLSLSIRILIAAGVVIIMAGGLGLYGVSLYNELMMRDESVSANWSEMTNMYRRRADLIPNVINAVQTYAAHERELLAELAEARSAMLANLDISNSNPEALLKLQQNQQKFNSGLGHLLAVAERYPDLKASTLFQDLIVELEGSENRISYARTRFIDAASAYNLSVRQFPSNLIAKEFGFKVRPKYEDENLKAVQQVPTMKAP